MDQDWGGSNFLSFYCLTISRTGNVTEAKLLSLKSYILSFDNCLNHSHSFEEIKCDEKYY